MIVTLYLANIAIPLWLAYKSSVNARGLEFSHVLMFTLGFLFYWVLPLGIGIFHIAADEPMLSLWYGLYNGVSDLTLQLYLGITLACYLSFWGGSEWVRRRLPEPQRQGKCYRPLFFFPQLLNAPLLITGLAAAFYAYLLRSELFTGYNVFQNPTPTQERSTFTALGVFLLSLAFLYTAKRDEKTKFSLTFHRLIANRFFAVYLLTAILVLSLGGRLDFISSLVMVLVYRTVYFRRLGLKSFALFSLLGVSFVGILGQVRQGQSVGLNRGLLNLVGEPIFCNLPVMHFLQVGRFELIKFPLFLIGDFVNLIPSAVFPAKLSLLINPEDYGYVVYAPLGGECSFFPFMINFGVLGTVAVLFLTGAGLSALRGRDRNLLFRVIYVMLTGWIGFTFFRDPFFVSLVKNMFEFSMALPILLIVAVQLVSVSLRAFSRRAPSEEARANALAGSLPAGDAGDG